MEHANSTFDRFVDGLIDAISAFVDFFVIGKHVTLSEAALFFLAFGRAVWFTVFGVNIGPTPGLLTHEVWTPFFWLVSLFHFGAFFTDNPVYRIAVLLLYAVVWLFLAILVGFTQYTSPALPTFTVFSFVSAFIAVRLIRDWRT